MSQLPSSWAVTPLLAVSDLLRGVTYTKEVAASQPAPGRLPVLRANNLQGRAFDLSDLVYVPSALVSAQQRIRSGDVIIATSSGSISVVGKAVQSEIDMDAGFGAFCGVLRPAQAIDARYFGYFFSTEGYRARVSAMARGSNINNLKREHFEALSLPVAPQAEQQRIADKLDTVLARVDACRGHLAGVAPLLKRFRQSVLASATSGQLTADLKASSSSHRAAESDDLPPGWRKLTFDELKAGEPYSLAIGPFGSSLKVSDYRDAGVPLVFVREIRAGRFGDARTKFVSEDKAQELSAHLVRPGDLLITKMGDPPGDVAIYPQHAPLAVITSDCIKLTVNCMIASAKFVSIVVASPQIRQRLRTIAAGVAQQKFSLARLRQFALPIPSPDEQAEIVRRVEALFVFADRLEARLTQAQTAVDRLTPALLAKAFRGELVPQDPTDEPATELLKRLAAHREAEPARRRSKRATA